MNQTSATPEPHFSDHQQPNTSNDSTHSANELLLPPGLDSGDIVLFNRRCTSMPLAGAVLCKMSKLFSNSQWDHVGIVIRHPATGELLFLEADFGGVKLRSLSERVRRSKSNEIAIRQLSIVRNSSMREKFYAFAQEMVGRPYEIGTGSVMVRISDPVAKKEKEYLNALIIEKQTIVNDIDTELETASVSMFQKRILLGERDRVTAEIYRLKKRLDPQFEATSVEETQPLSSPQVSTKYKGDLSRVFCSELVAAAYQRVDLIGAYPPPFYYSPKDFSSEDASIPGVMLLNNVKLSAEKYLRRSARTSRDSLNRQKSFSGVYDGEKPSRDQRNLIRDALKRTPLYSQVPDEYKRSQLVKSFRARVVEPGDVVFEQGDYGDRFYIVASGEVERWHSRGEQAPILLSTLGSRTSFGLTGFSFNNVARVATLRAKQRTLLWELDRPTFERFKDASGDTQSIISAADRRLLRRHLQEHFLFKRLDKIGPNELKPFFLVKFRAGENVFEQGDTGDNMYLIKSGELERHTWNPKRRRIGENDTEVVSDDQGARVKTLHKGQSFGELSLMYNAPRAATIRARTDSECWAISAAAYHRLNLGGGNQHLRTVFKNNASIEKDGEPYMTKDDLLRFIGIHAFPEQDRERLAGLLVSLIASNRAKDPITTRSRKNGNNPSTLRSLNSGGNEDSTGGEANHDILLSFWEFCRFDIVINNPDADMEVAFRRSDQSNTGFISLDDMEELLLEYADYDVRARNMLSGDDSTLRSVFGRDGTRTLSMKDFNDVSKDILPPLFREDIHRIREHFINADAVGSATSSERDVEEIPYLGPYAAPTLLGSQFVGAKAIPVASRSILQTHSTYPPNLPAWMTTVHWSDWLTLCLTGVISRTAVAPLERVKMLMQTGDRSQYSKGWISSLRQMVAEDTGIRRALFRQNGANILRTVPSTIIQTALVTRLATSPEAISWVNASGGALGEDMPSAVTSSAGNRTILALFAGGVAGMVSQTATYPFDFVRARLAMQRKGFEPYRGAFHGINEAIRMEGMRSIYRGLFPTLVGSFSFVGITLAVYETCLLPILPRRNGDPTNTPTPGGLVAAGIMANMTSQVATYPIDTCRRRMQVAGFDQRGTLQSTGFLNAWKDIGRQLGWRGYFRGALPNAFKIAPSTAVSLLVYERLRPRLDAAEGAAGNLFSQSSPHVRSR
ncbi:Mitochondrial adenine nucleotide transporter ADNT1 [Gracilariopsis chorda]|uniref:Mitochondrial adenine nucleotide transporter ADNT1 n=1 Tax=Gracilariopsis chorda TaxID=448386 RepID=A0A2V3IUG4_9FLOR|nr:Mitochondrial adenine nucleotide transporter ADNT1 [Gracilariopsis chorda]|eukprot:PXF45357.1 Mitochondrial adenine nucleotide transporter ADNT1 [Gracilariopsis chorda]